MSKNPKNPRNDLRSGFLALNVNAAYRLKESAPKLKPPFEAPQEKVAQKELSHKEAPQFGVPQTQLPQNEAAALSKEILRKSAEPTQNEEPRDEHTQKEVAQTKPPQNELAQRKAPNNEVIQNVRPEPGGFFKLAHSVFSEPMLQSLSGDSFRLFIWLSSQAWRFANSKGLVRASVRHIEEVTGMGHATVSRGLKTLKEAKLIQVVEVDYKQGNVWKVSALALGSRAPEPTPPQNEPPQDEQPENEKEPTSNRGTSPLKTSTRLPQNECNIRSIKKENKLKEKEPAKIISFQTEEIISDEMREIAIRNFDAALDDAGRKSFMKNFKLREFPHGYFPPSRVIHSMAAVAWYATDSFSARANAAQP